LIVDSVLVNAKAYINKTIVDCSIAVNNKKITKIGKETNMPKADTKINLKNLLTLPGLIDTHVHLRDEGKAYKEDFYSGTAAAAAGGITTVLDMPNNQPVTMSAETLRNRIKTAEKKILVSVGFFSEFPKTTKEIERIAEEGAIGFKLFMADQIGSLNIDDDQAILQAFKTVDDLNLPTAVHAEDHTELERAEHELKNAGREDINAFLKAHSEDVETRAVNRQIRIVKQTQMHLHFCHISTRNALDAVVDAKRSGLKISCEATPHHLFLSAAELKQIGMIGITMPPVRNKGHMLALWNGIEHKSIDVIGSDHAPHTIEEKKHASVWDVKVGIPGLETTLPLLLTKVRQGRLTVGDLVELMSENPAKIFKLKERGGLKEGNRADFTVVDLDKTHKIDTSNFHSKAKFSPFDGRVVQGKVVRTLVNGQIIMEDGEIMADAGSGEIIRRE
jgi:dihydroorotase